MEACRSRLRSRSSSPWASSSPLRRSPEPRSRPSAARRCRSRRGDRPWRRRRLDRVEFEPSTAWRRRGSGPRCSTSCAAPPSRCSSRSRSGAASAAPTTSTRCCAPGADKVSINTAAILRPTLLHEASRRFGAQCIVLSVDARTVPEGEPPTPSGWEVTTHGGRRGTGIDAVEWAARGQELGVGEILLNSMDADGTRAGFDLRMIAAVRAAVDVPVIASGGAGRGRGLRARGGSGRRRRPRRHGVPLRTLPDRRRQGQPAGGGGGGQVTLDPAIAARLKRDADGLVCAVAQQRGTGEVLMVAWMDDEALHRTLTTGRATYWSRSRQEYWVKGDTSGQRPEGPRGAAGLRRRRAARGRRPDRARVPHRRPHLLRRRRAALS